MDASMVVRHGRADGSTWALRDASPRSAARKTGTSRLGCGALALLAMLLAAIPSQGRADDVEPADSPVSKPSDWTFEVVPYLWLPEVQGTVSTRGRSAAVDVDFGDVFDLLGDGELLALMGHFEAKYRRLSLFIDAIGGTARPTSLITVGPRNGITAKGDLTLNFSYVEFGPAFRLLDLPVDAKGRAITLDALAGGRFMYFYQSITLAGTRGRLSPTVRATTTWVDPFIGGRFSVPLVGDLSLMFRGDIGGFGAGSELAWNLIGGFQYELPWHPGEARTFVVAAYKALDFDYKTGSGVDTTTMALDQRGPGIGLGFEF